jgi:cyclopropane-fatty-acyl-phospholipid synthase
MTAMAANSDLSLEGYDNICMHYAQTLKDWRYRFNDAAAAVRSQGFDDVFIRCWNYYFTYCEAGFHSGTEGCLILVFSRPGNAAILLPGSLTKSILARNASS